MTDTPSRPPGAFHAFEHAGWSDESIATAYHDAFERLTTQAIPSLLDAIHAGPGTRLLDVATGPGYVAAAAAERGASVVAIDFSPAMVEQARKRYEGIDFRTGDAQALDLPDATFDAVAINFGMLHFEDPNRALAEAFRVLRPGGCIAFTVWAPPEKTAFGLVMAAASTYGVPADLPPGPAFSRFSDANESRSALANAGFTNNDVIEVPQTWRFPDLDAFFAALTDATVRNRGLLLSQPPDNLARIKATVSDSLQAYMQPDGTLLLPMPAMLASATKGS